MNYSWRLKISHIHLPNVRQLTLTIYMQPYKRTWSIRTRHIFSKTKQKKAEPLSLRGKRSEWEEKNPRGWDEGWESQANQKPCKSCRLIHKKTLTKIHQVEEKICQHNALMTGRRNKVKKRMHSVIPEPRVSLNPGLFSKDIIVLAFKVVDYLLEPDQEDFGRK